MLLLTVENPATATFLDARFGAFVAVFALLIITPGPDTALTIRNTLRGGPRAAWMTAIGVGVGSAAWMLAAILGVSVVLERAPAAFAAFKLAGALYLSYLGVVSLASAFRRRARTRVEAAAPGGLSDGAAWRQGLISNVLNAKMGVFFLSLLPQFVDQADPPLRALAMVLVYEAMVIGWLGAYGHAVNAVAGMARAQARPWLDAATGVVLLVLAARVALGAQA